MSDGNAGYAVEKSARGKAPRLRNGGKRRESDGAGAVSQSVY